VESGRRVKKDECNDSDLMVGTVSQVHSSSGLIPWGALEVQGCDLPGGTGPEGESDMATVFSACEKPGEAIAPSGRC